MELKWTTLALNDLDDTGNYIAEDNPRSAAVMAQRIIDTCDYQLEHPNLL
ncbi:MAG: type II toxin-antitoxin system RelE/ParE family toxin [Gammaproteobacteria bacterium]|nr:type II toxin-antitoxin system RelE/ParE family toxin [Gammaproteobacteria bacterium]